MLFIVSRAVVEQVKTGLGVTSFMYLAILSTTFCTLTGYIPALLYDPLVIGFMSV
jgi:hypothetical protein